MSTITATRCPHGKRPGVHEESGQMSALSQSRGGDVAWSLAADTFTGVTGHRPAARPGSRHPSWVPGRDAVVDTMTTLGRLHCSNHTQAALPLCSPAGASDADVPSGTDSCLVDGTDSRPSLSEIASEPSL